MKQYKTGKVLTFIYRKDTIMASKAMVLWQ